MRIACLQFSPQLGKVEENIARANGLLSQTSNRIPPIDILVLPELAFSGYNFPSLSAIKPFLERRESGPSSKWAQETAARLDCIVTVGYPELVALSPAAPSSSSSSSSSSDLKCYNSTITYSPTGAVLAHYRKTHLYYTGETWAQESPTGWLTVPLLLPQRGAPTTTTTITPAPSVLLTTFGICMDLNPYRFTAEWTAYEFCTHALGARSELLLLSMAWLTNAPPPPPPPPDPLARHDEASTTAAAAAAAARAEPDMETLRYWFARMEPLILAETERVVALANRCGDEPPAARYAGTSWIGRVGKGRIGIWGLMGRGEEGVLEVDTEGKPKWVWEMRRRRRDDDDDDDGNGDD